MTAHKFCSNRKTKAVPALAGAALKRLKQVFFCLGWQSRSGISDRDNPILLGFGGPDCDLARFTAVYDRLARISNEIRQNPMYLFGIRSYDQSGWYVFRITYILITRSKALTFYDNVDQFRDYHTGKRRRRFFGLAECQRRFT